MPDSYTIDPSEFVPAAAGSEPVIGAPTGKPGKVPIKINPAEFKPVSKYPVVADPKETLDKAVDAMAPHSNTQAVLMALGGVLPFAGEIAPLVEGLSPELAKGLTYLSGKGLGPLLARIGTQTAAGAGAAAATGEPVKQAAIESAEVGTLGELPAPIASTIAGVGIAEKAGAAAMRESAADTVAQKALENELGMTAEKAQGLAKPTEVGVGAQELAGAKKALGETRHSAIREVGDKYEPIYGPIADNPTPTNRQEEIGAAANNAAQWAAERGARLAPGTQKLLNELGAQGGETKAQVAELLRGGKGVDPAAVGRFNAILKQQAATGKLMDRAGLEKAATEALGINTPNIGQLRGNLGRIVQEANRPGSSAMDRHVLMDASKPIIETLNDAIPDEQKPLLQSINNEYAQINRIFPFRDLKKLQAAATLPELGDAVFGPQAGPATAMAIKRMNPQQQDLMRQAFASSILKDSASPTETLSKLQANKDTVKALYPDSPFGNIETWRKAMIAQKKFLQGPPNLPAQKAFEEGVQETIKKSGLTPEAMQAATAALSDSGKAGWLRMSPYMIASGISGYGLIGHVPGVGVGIAGYALGHAGWKALANNPAMMDVYRQAITSGWTRAGGDALGRLIVEGVNDAVRGSAPHHQATGIMEPGPGVKSLDTAHSEHIAPTPSASKRASEVKQDLGKGKNPEVHADLQRGRLSLDEVNRIVKHSARTDAMAMLDEVPLSEAMDAVEIASPEERKMMIPLVQQKMRESFQGGKFNRTLAANLAKRLQKIQAMA